MPYRWGNRGLWAVLQRHRAKIGAAFAGHFHGYRHYVADGIPVWISGGGGGRLARGHGYHWLLITVWGNLFWVKKQEVTK
jgi:hypothetical protein